MTNRRNARRRLSRNAALPADFLDRILKKFYLKPLVDVLNGNIHRSTIRRLKRRNYLETGSATRWRKIEPGSGIWYALELEREWTPMPPLEGDLAMMPITWNRNQPMPQ